jgi:GNAT superfamily N-acetyltransferase
MTIRAAVPEDLAEICALIRELAEYEGLTDEVVFDEVEVGRWIFDEQVARVLIAHEGDAVVGMALWFPTFSTFLGRPGIWLEDLFVRPAFRGSGHGLALLNELRSMTDGRVEWSVLDWNEPSIRLYESLGARPHEGWTTYRWVGTDHQ